ncbi:hypothetical protein VCRA2121O391_360043 [Vibrio crassostreae]|nr:hypothetical protein VCRA2113O351_280015 [Vibrio crassostreae]CAK1963924.1 hypothetical protein VCRA2117O37_270051 [Vibrio crassostreae]CAK2113193.1 hypothetical protein VCRA2113O356_400041 [Vibrio crassostreae]CAK2364187.1 hypothetical protein VCRA2119O386_400015 [Vibrio crassostreae]CAK2396635.1 hypothetical protein VCRA2119O52_100016 [Vibrio crassostreae]
MIFWGRNSLDAKENQSNNQELRNSMPHHKLAIIKYFLPNKHVNF